jgi:hypothetical protein
MSFEAFERGEATRETVIGIYTLWESQKTKEGCDLLITFTRHTCHPSPGNLPTYPPYQSRHQRLP